MLLRRLQGELHNMKHSMIIMKQNGSNCVFTVNPDSVVCGVSEGVSRWNLLVVGGPRRVQSTVAEAQLLVQSPSQVVVRGGAEVAGKSVLLNKTVAAVW